MPTPSFDATDRDDWRRWLAAHGETESEVWLILYKQDLGRGVGYVESVEEALCFGWIDGHTKGRDERSRFQRFTPRKPSGTWSKSNRERAERLIAEGRMTPAGQALVDLAKRTGTWDALAEAQDGVVPDDLRHALDADPAAAANFDAFRPSAQKQILLWISTAKRPETRAKRIAQTVESAARNVPAR